MVCVESELQCLSYYRDLLVYDLSYRYWSARCRNMV